VAAGYNRLVESLHQPGYLAGRRAVVLGGTSGLGAICTRHLLAHGVDILATGRTLPGELGQTAGEAPARLHLLVFDYPRHPVSAVAKEAGRTPGLPLHILLHCLGPVIAKPVAETGTEELLRLLHVNAVSFHEALLEFAPLLAPGGRVVVLTVAGAENLLARTLLPAYFAAKAALLSLVKSWVRPLAARGITVNGIAPGLFRGELELDAARKVPMGRPGEPGDLEQALRFLLAPASGYITGNNIVVSGGYGL